MLLSFPAVGQADGNTFSLGDCSDDVQRVETRLADLGYFKGVVNGRWDQADADAFAAFAAANGVATAAATDLLFSNSAIAAALNGGTVFASGPQGFLLTYGTLVSWEEIQPKLVVGQSYDMTSCYSGLSLHMKCVAVGNQAKMQPELDWDNATLRGFFSSASSSEKQPVVITLDGVAIAASIQQAPPVNDPAALPVYRVYFHNSSTGINGIPDAEHEAIIQIAANQQ
ncbi:MAG: putative peptidoglycan binding domain-containing protein [Christensenella sp.]|nr:putative peptidoglycan binding domain-containing protein [Christensenella sp.]